MLAVVLTVLLLNVCRGDMTDIVQEDIKIVNLSNAIAERYLTRCAVLLNADDATLEEQRRHFRIAKMLSSTMFVVVKTFTQYFEHVEYRYNTHRCPKMFNIICSLDKTAKENLEKFPHAEKYGGPIWLLIQSKSSSPAEILRNVNISFNVLFITATLKESVVTLKEAYRVSANHDIRIKPFGNWTAEEGLISPEHILPYTRRSDMEGIVIKAAYNEDPPIATCPDPVAGCKTALAGYFGFVWRDLEERLNFSTEFVTCPDQQYGVFINGSWNGLVGMVVRKEVDAAVAEMTLLPERLPFVDYLRPIYVTSYQIFFRRSGVLTEWDVILHPFGFNIWIVLLLWVFLFSVLLWFFFRIGVTFKFEDKTLEREFGSVQVVFVLLSAISQQGNPFVPGSYGCRLIILTAYLLSVVLATAYSGSLTSFITVEKPIRPFSSFQTMLEDGTYTMEQIPGTSGFSYFAKSTDPVLQKVYQKLFSKLPDKDLPKTGTEALQRVCNKYKTAYFAEYGVTEFAAKEFLSKYGCQLLVLETPIGAAYISPLVQKESPYAGALNYHLYSMHYQGILHKFRLAAWGPVQGNIPTNFHAVRAEEVSSILYLLVIGTVLAVFIVLLEMLAKRSRLNADANIILWQN